MNRTTENWYPFISATAASAAFFLAQRHYDWQAPPTIPSLFAAIINVCAIAIGFLAAAQSILIAMESREVIRRLKENEYLALITHYLLRAITWSFWLSAVSAGGMLIDATKTHNWLMPTLTAWIFLLVGASLAYYRIIKLFAKILKMGLSEVSPASGS